MCVSHVCVYACVRVRACVRACMRVCGGGGGAGGGVNGCECAYVRVKTVPMDRYTVRRLHSLDKINF